jgi:hypothetical protein
LKKLDPVLHGNLRHRVRLDLIDLSLCLIAARVLPRLVKHGHAAPPRTDYLAASRRLVRQLENWRKRAKRSCIRTLGIGQYRDLHSRWARFGRWLQRISLFCMCGRAYI